MAAVRDRLGRSAPLGQPVERGDLRPRRASPQRLEHPRGGSAFPSGSGALGGFLAPVHPEDTTGLGAQQGRAAGPRRGRRVVGQLVRGRVPQAALADLQLGQGPGMVQEDDRLAEAGARDVQPLCPVREADGEAQQRRARGGTGEVGDELHGGGERVVDPGSRQLTSRTRPSPRWAIA